MTAPTEVHTITATDGTVYGPDLQPLVPQPTFTQPTAEDGTTVPASTLAPPPAGVDAELQARARDMETALRGRVRWYSSNRPRSLQRRLGPSEVGTPCTRQLAYKVAQHPPVNHDGGDPWPSFVGTATHAELEQVFSGTPEEWLTEQRVVVDDELDLAGSADLLRLAADGNTVVDHKVVGTTTMKKIRSSGPSATYRTQINLYAHGFIRRGIPVEYVAIAFWPRSGQLSGLQVWLRRYDQNVVDDALNRLQVVRTLHGALGDQLFAQLPTAESYCTSCPFYMPGSTDPAVSCPGATS